MSSKRERDRDRDIERDKHSHGEGEHITPATPRVTQRRWAAVDTMVVLALVLAIVGVLVRGFMAQKETPQGEMSGPYDVYFVVEEIHSSVLSEISGFDVLYDRETGKMVGYLGVYANGSPAISATGVLPIKGGDWVSAQGCFVCLEGVMEDGNLLPYETETYLSPGSVLTVRTERAVMTIKITQISQRK